MRSKLGALAFGLLATTALAISALGAPGGVSAADPPPESPDAALASGDHTRLPYWIKNSIIACAARTMDERAAAVKAALRQGLSLKEIGVRHGVRPEVLEHGILRCERQLLDRLVQAGKLTRPHLQLPGGAHHPDHQLPLPARRPRPCVTLPTAKRGWLANAALLPCGRSTREGAGHCDPRLPLAFKPG
jgi:transposase-like protein